MLEPPKTDSVLILLAPEFANIHQQTLFSRLAPLLYKELPSLGHELYLLGNFLVDGVPAKRVLYGQTAEVLEQISHWSIRGVLSFLNRGVQHPFLDLTPDVTIAYPAAFPILKRIHVHEWIECQVWLQRLQFPVLMQPSKDLPASMVRSVDEGEILSREFLELADRQGLQLSEFAEDARVVHQCFVAQKGRILSFQETEEIEPFALNHREGPLFSPTITMDSSDLDCMRDLSRRLAKYNQLSGWFECCYLKDRIGGRIRLHRVASCLSEAGLIGFRRQGLALLKRLLGLENDSADPATSSPYTATLAPATRGLAIDVRPDSAISLSHESPVQLVSSVIDLCRAHPTRSGEQSFMHRLSKVLQERESKSRKPIETAYSVRWPLHFVELIEQAGYSQVPARQSSRMLQVDRIMSRVDRSRLPMETWFSAIHRQELIEQFPEGPLIYINAYADIGYLADSRAVQTLISEEFPIVAVESVQGREYWIERFAGPLKQICFMQIEGPPHPSLGDSLVCTQPQTMPAISEDFLNALDSCLDDSSQGWHARLVERDHELRIRWVLPGVGRYHMLGRFSRQAHEAVWVRVPRLGVPGRRPDPCCTPIAGGAHRAEALTQAYLQAGLPRNPTRIVLLAYELPSRIRQTLAGFASLVCAKGVTLCVPDTSAMNEALADLDVQTFAGALNDLRAVRYFRDEDVIVCPLTWHSSSQIPSLRRILDGASKRGIPVLPDLSMAGLWFSTGVLKSRAELSGSFQDAV